MCQGKLARASLEVIEEMSAIAKEMKEASDRGEQLGLSEDELVFYEALETNDCALANAWIIKSLYIFI